MLKDWKKKVYGKFQIAWNYDKEDTFDMHFARTKDTATIIQDKKYVLWLNKSWGSAHSLQWEKGFNSMPEAIKYAKNYMRNH